MHFRFGRLPRVTIATEQLAIWSLTHSGLLLSTRLHKKDFSPTFASDPEKAVLRRVVPLMASYRTSVGICLSPVLQIPHGALASQQPESESQYYIGVIFVITEKKMETTIGGL